MATQWEHIQTSKRTTSRSTLTADRTSLTRSRRGQAGRVTPCKRMVVQREKDPAAGMARTRTTGRIVTGVQTTVLRGLMSFRTYGGGDHPRFNCVVAFLSAGVVWAAL